MTYAPRRAGDRYRCRSDGPSNPDLDSNPDFDPDPDMDPNGVDAPQAPERLRAAKLLAFDVELLAWMRRRTPPPIESGSGSGEWAQPHRLVGFDEAGRGALAGPVVVGCVCFGSSPLVVGRTTGAVPSLTLIPAAWSLIDRLIGLDDSKKLSPSRRTSLYERIIDPAASFGSAWAAGSATAAEIDAMGIVGACRLAAARAWRGLQRTLAGAATTTEPHLGAGGDHPGLGFGLVFDRNLSLPGLQAAEYPRSDPGTTRQLGLLEEQVPSCRRNGPPSVWCTRGDGRSFHVAAASVIAKVTRDRIMKRLAVSFPEYGWESNMGYGTQRHRETLCRLGATPQHRRLFRGT